jgi:hypothetical protein
MTWARGPRLRASAAVAVLALVPLAPRAVATATQPSNCAFLAVSDGFATDGTAFCAGLAFRPTALDLWATHDHARSWSKRAATGLPVTSTTWLAQLLVSPVYGSDHALYVSFTNGSLYRSVDGGDTFVLAVPVTGAYTLGTSIAGALGGVPSPVPPVGPLLHSVVYSAEGGIGSNHDYLVDPQVVTVRPLAGSPARDRVFVVPPDNASTGALWVVGASGNGAEQIDTLYECAAATACATALSVLGAPRERFTALWFAADYSRSHVVFLLTTDLDYGVHFYRSTDGAHHFTPIPALDNARRYVRDSRPNVGIAPGPAGSRVVYTVLAGYGDVNTANARLYRSDDDGAHWTLVSWGRAAYRHGRWSLTGALPPGYVYGPYTASAPHHDGFLRYTGDGLLLMSAGLVVYCSANRGRTWTIGCR